MLLTRALVAPLLLLRSPSPLMQESSSGDELLMAAMASLQERNATGAVRQLALAREAYDALPDGPSEDQQSLISLVSSRVDAALLGGKKEIKRPPPPTAEELKIRADAKARGERALMNCVQAFGDKSDEARFGKAQALLAEARSNFRRAGDEVERERDNVMGNLYSAIRAEEERSQRVKKLVRMKKLLELTKQKRKAETLGIDPEDFEAALSEPSASAAPPAPAPESMADDILSAWKAEGVDAEGQKIDELERQIEDLEDSL